MIAPIGIPFASGFAIVIMSGWQSLGKYECAHNLPVRPRPHCIQACKSQYERSRHLKRPTCLDFIVDQDSTDFITSFAECSEPFFPSRHDSSFSLDWLNDNAARLLGHELLYAGDVIEFCFHATWNEGFEWRLILFLVCDGEGAHRSAMEGFVEGDDLCFLTCRIDELSVFACKFESSFCGFCTRV